VIDFNELPPEMETLVIPRGLYAVFIHKGPAAREKRHTGIFLKLGCRVLHTILTAGALRGDGSKV